MVNIKIFKISFFSLTCLSPVKSSNILLAQKLKLITSSYHFKSVWITHFIAPRSRGEGNMIYLINSTFWDLGQILKWDVIKYLQCLTPHCIGGQSPCLATDAGTMPIRDTLSPDMQCDSGNCHNGLTFSHVLISTDTLLNNLTLNLHCAVSAHYFLQYANYHYYLTVYCPSDLCSEKENFWVPAQQHAGCRSAFLTRSWMLGVSCVSCWGSAQLSVDRRHHGGHHLQERQRQARLLRQ